LSALIPATPGAGTAAGPGVDTVDIDLIVPNPHQPRARMEPEALQDLADSIREHGLLQPIVVTEASSSLGPKTYQLIAGERRLQAARMAGVTRIPVVVREAAGAELLEIALVENLLREDLNPIEEARAFRRLNDEFGIRQEHIAKRIGRSRGTVTNTLRLLSLPKEIQESLSAGQITEGHARALLGVEDARVRLDLWRKILSDELTVRQAEQIARSLRGAGGAAAKRSVAKGRRVDPHVRAIEDDLRHALGMQVAVRRGSRGGSVMIRFHNDEELESIIERITR
jgi:ParB family chromosome partitioning protein